MKKLLMISTDRKILEEESAVRARQAAYAKEWDEVHIIVFAPTGGETVIAQNCWAYPTRSSSKSMDPFAAMRLGRFLVEKRGITHVTCQDPFLTSMTGVALKKQFPQLELEMQVHTDVGSPYFTHSFGNKVRKFLALNYLPKADHIRVVSNKIRDFLIEKLAIDGAKIEVRPIAVDSQKIKDAPIVEVADLRKRFPQFEKIVLMASRLEKEKNIESAIKAWVKVAEKMPKAGLVIVGSGSKLAFLKALAANLRVEKEVMFEEWADQPTLFSYYKTADIFLNTSLFEGYGMTLVEAQAAGCEIVSTDVGVAREVGAEIVPFMDIGAITDAIVKKLS